MGIIVQKYGGTSVGSLEKIKFVANKVAKRYRNGHDVAVVLSAMSGETDKLIKLAKELSPSPDPREMDVIVSTGEQVSIALLAMALKDLGVPARSLLGFQIGIKTDDAFMKARIMDIDTRVLKKAFAAKEVVVVAGFQGVTEDMDITTLGRGGSDTSAVALAAVLGAELCEIYTDVDGVYTCDPNICDKARRLEKISYDEMLEMASLGAKVLQTRSVEFAKKYNVPILVKSTFTDEGGTLTTQEDREMEKEVVSGITYDKNEAKITILGVQDKPGVAAKIFSPLSEKNINVDMIIQNVSADGKLADMSFTVTKSDFDKALAIVRQLAGEIGCRDVVGDLSIAKISIVGVGMRSHAGVASKMFSALSGVGINIQMISTSEIKVSCVIDEKFIELGVRVLHEAFELDKPRGDV
ncbi:MAG TPA: aspartate kinase [Deltaproteobacteria bacterium]|nr:aspartate kinase [Deltaproteobacteria bacterium]HPR54370.1 aspartate kinase [Deltaproteobacteria bacterium]HXK46991.1 aspartate kinase [Deltaproteobacteria bacterium]